MATLPPMTATLALVPLRSPGEGKTRLAGSLSRAGRAELAAAMLADVLKALADSPVDRIVVAASGPGGAELATRLGAQVVTDPPGVSSLNAAIAAAAQRLAPVTGLLVVMADLPCLTGRDVGHLLAVQAPVGLAPTEDGGTGGLLRRPVGALPSAFGPSSAARHADLAAATGTPLEVVHRPGFARDLDTPEDLAGLGSWPVGAATRSWLRRQDRARLAAHR